MRRIQSLALMVGLFAPVGLVGCGEESKVETKDTVSTPGGTATTTKTEKVETTGENPPPAVPPK